MAERERGSEEDKSVSTLLYICLSCLSVCRARQMISGVQCNNRTAASATDFAVAGAR